MVLPGVCSYETIEWNHRLTTGPHSGLGYEPPKNIMRQDIEEAARMAGLSMGSMQTMSITMANLDKYSWIGLFSGSTVSGDLKTAYNGAFSDPEKFNGSVHLIFMGAGTAESNLIQGMDNARTLLDNAGIKTYAIYKSDKTAHEWHTWRRCLNDFVPRLFQK